MTFDLDNITVLVTGSSQGIGRAIADLLMKNGARVAVHYNKNKSKAEELISKYPDTGSFAVQADLSDEAQVERLFQQVTDRFESIDVIVHNAAVFMEHSSNMSTSEWFEVWKDTIQINLNSVGLLTKLGLDHFKKNKGGRFIFIGSRAVFRGETEEFLAYAASKGGITSLSRSIARSFGKENIYSFVIAPGFTRTQMAEAFISKYGEERVLNELAINKLTEPKDIAPVVALICSGNMDHATGSTIDINAGSHIR